MDSGPLALLRRLQRLPSLPLGLPFAVRFRRLDDRLLARPHLQSEHTHSEHELMLSLRGVYTCRIDGHPLRIPAGGAIAVQPGDRHQDDTATPVIFRAICFDLLPGPRPGVSASLLRAGTPPGIRAIARAPALYDLAARLERSERVGGGAASLLQDALCAELVTQLAALLPLDCLAPALATRLAQAGFGQDLLDLFARHPDGRLAVPAMAAALGLGERRFHLRCRKELGSSPARLYLRYRLGWPGRSCAPSAAASPPSPRVWASPIPPTSPLPTAAALAARPRGASAPGARAGIGRPAAEARACRQRWIKPQTS